MPLSSCLSALFDAKSFLVTLLIGIITFSLPSSAQTHSQKEPLKAAAKLKVPCKAELDKYCSNIAPSDEKVVLCLLAHSDKITRSCSFSIVSVADQLSESIANIAGQILVSPIARICLYDIENHCSKVKVGGGRVLKCLAENKDRISSTCRSRVMRPDPKI